VKRESSVLFYENSHVAPHSKLAACSPRVRETIKERGVTFPGNLHELVKCLSCDCFFLKRVGKRTRSHDLWARSPPRRAARPIAISKSRNRLTVVTGKKKGTEKYCTM
jgi:hypothetical protein